MRSAKLSVVVAALLTAASLPVFAQTVQNEVDRNVNQQQRIEQGLKSGQLNTREAARLEREEAKVDRMQSRALRDGKVSPDEAARIKAEQNKVSQDIYRERHDAQKGNPNSASSQRMQADAQRNVNQQERIANGVKSGELTNREVGKLEQGQARVTRMEANAGRDGHVGPNEQRRIQKAENVQSSRIYNQKHDAQKRP